MIANIFTMIAIIIAAAANKIMRLCAYLCVCVCVFCVDKIM